MCATCGCGEPDAATVTAVGSRTAHPHLHSHGDGHTHSHGDDHRDDHVHVPRTHTIELERDVLAKNDRLAERNRHWLAEHGILALNLMSSPGSGKTTLLERTIRDRGERWSVSVVEGDQETLLDGQRIRATGRPAVQINTGSGCHLDAEMLWQGLTVLQPADGSVVVVENVGNLVCPALFDLGERAKVVVISTPEGEDKPLKYPHMVRAADVLLINKIDLLPYLNFSLDRCAGFARDVNPGVQVLPISATTGEGLNVWYDWVQEHLG